MKLTTKALKQLIKEELSEMMGSPMPDVYYDEQTEMMAQQIMGLESYRNGPGDGNVRMELASIGLETDDQIEDARNKLLGGRGQTPDEIAKFLTNVLAPTSHRHSY